MEFAMFPLWPGTFAEQCPGGLVGIDLPAVQIVHRIQIGVASSALTRGRVSGRA